VSLVVSQLDYGSATLLAFLHVIMNAAARLIYRSRKCGHVTPLMCDLYWLQIPERITFRLAVWTYHCYSGLTAQYLADELHQVAEVESW